MFCYRTTIKLRDTDATGVLFFTEQLRLALEAFETYLSSLGISLNSLLASSGYLMPIVHAEADFAAPLRLGDAIEIHWGLENIGNSSFTFVSHFLKAEDRRSSGKVKIVHVAVDKHTGSKIVLPKAVLELLQAAPRALATVSDQV